MKKNSLGLAFLLCLVAALPIHAGEFLPGFAEREIERPDGAQAWNEAVGVAFSGSGRMFVWERGGRVWIVDETSPVQQPMLDISDEVLSWRDHGMLGFALDPAFDTTGYLYLYYPVDVYHLTNCDSPANGAPSCIAGYDPATTWLPNDPATPGFKRAPIGRIVRYQAIKPAADADYRRASQINYASRRVLLGETTRTGPKNTGLPLLFESHGIGTLVFATDGTLLASGGDGASFKREDVGYDDATYYALALQDGVIQPKENIGALRAQLIDSLNGKIIRIDPATGNGLASNPYYDPAAPRAARSRVWARGLRNPYRMSVRPGTGSHFAADGNPGVILIGDVGYSSWEEINMAVVGGKNFGWPLYEGMDPLAVYQQAAANISNLDAANPLFGQGGCSRQDFRFTELIIQDRTTTPSFPNPCNAAQQIPASAYPAVHTRPLIDWSHTSNTARWSAYAANGSAIAPSIGTAAPNGTIVQGTPFTGSTATDGGFFDGAGFPAEYANRYFFGDYGGQWIRSLIFDNNRVVSVNTFGSDLGGIVALASNHHRNGLFYIAWTAFVRQITYSPAGSTPPIAAAAAIPSFGSNPLTVTFSSAGSYDPDGGAITYAWDFGDGTTSTQANPTHVYNAGTTAVRNYDATLTVRDVQSMTAATTLLISVNNTPPTAQITSPIDGSTYSMTGGPFNVNLRANISDMQSPAGSLQCEWQQALYHNQHEHSDPFIAGCDASSIITPIGCDGQQYAYGFRIFVTDPNGLTTTDEVRMYPDCGSGPGSDVTPPSVPAGLTANALDNTRIVLNWSASSDAGAGVAGYRVLRGETVIATVAGTTYTDQGLSPNTAYTYSVLAYDNATPSNSSVPSTPASATTLLTGSTIIRVNAGGPVYTDTLGQAWSADTGFNTGSTSGAGNVGIANTVEDTLYQTERFDPVAAPELQYAFNVPNGSYLVRLHFAETFFGPGFPNNGIGSRVFDVDIEGVERFANLDVIVEAGGQNRALVKTVTLNVTDGQMNILFRRQVENPQINAIELLPQAPDVTPPSTPPGVTATPLTTTSIRLNWNASIDTGLGVAGYRVFRGATQVGGTITALTYTDTGLTPSTAYSYTIVALDNATPTNVSAASAAVIATTLTPDTSPPSVPAGVAATALTTTSIRVNWNASTDVGGGVVTGYRVFRGATQVGGTIAGLTYTDTGLTPATAYNYTVVALDNATPANVSAASATASATTLTPVVDVTPPSVPTGLSAAAQSATQIGLTWNAATDTGGSGLAGYRVFRGAAQVGGTITGLTYTDTGLTANTLYSYTVVAFDNASPANVSGASAPASATTLAQSSTVVRVNAGGAAFTDSLGQAWSADSGFNTGNTTSTAAAIANTVDDVLYQNDRFDPVAAPELQYTFSVPNGSYQVRLHFAETYWNTAAFRVFDVDMEGVERFANVDIFAEAGGANRALIKTVTLNVTDGALNILFRHQTENPSVAAIEILGQTPDTTAPTVPGNVSATALTTTSIRLNWNASIDTGLGVAGYRVFRGATQVGGTITALTYTDTGLTPSTAYSYTIVALDNATPANVSAASAPATATTLTPVVDTIPPSTPTSFSATAISSTQIQLAWNAATDTGGSGLAGYRVFRGATQVGGTITGLTYTDTGLTANTLYSYSIVAFDNALPANVSPASPPASATTLIAGSTVIRVNSGGPAYTDSLGQAWAADNGFNTGNTGSVATAIANTVEDVIYQSERWDPTAAPDLQYSFTVPNGTYLIRLHLAETFIDTSYPNGGVGQRVFDVDIEGVERFANIDILSEAAGPNRALIKSVTLPIADGQINILFRHQVENPAIGGIEIIRQ